MKAKVFPRHFGRYILLDKIAEGGMAEVYRAVTLSGGTFRWVAIKVILPEKSQDVSVQEMFRAEIKVMLQLGHPNVVQILDYGQEDECFFIAMEYLRGKSLNELFRDLRQQNLYMPRRLVFFLMDQLARGLNYIHGFVDPTTGKPSPIIHRDVSPHNILYSFDGIPKLLDFGMAKSAQSSGRTNPGVLRGKIPYLSPELLRQARPSPLSDIFALGTVFWEFLVGQRLFSAEGKNDYDILLSIDQSAQTVKAPSEFNPKVTPEMDRIILKCLQHDPAKRYQSGAELSVDLKKLLANDFPETNQALSKKFITKSYEIERAGEELQLQILLIDARKLLGNEETVSSGAEVKEFKPKEGSGRMNISISNLDVANVLHKSKIKKGTG